MNKKLENPVERLDPAECWELLGPVTVARLAVVVDRQPEIFPVNYVLDKGTVVFRSDVGTKVRAAIQDLCAMEADGYDPGTGTAWSVVVKGPARIISDPQEKKDVDALHLDPWQPGPKVHYLRLLPAVVTGRRFKTTRPDIWTTPVTDARTEEFH